MSYATPERFRLSGLPARALDGISDPEIQALLDDAFDEINEELRGRNVAVPVTSPPAPAEAVRSLGAIEIRIAQADLLAGYRGTSPDDPGMEAATARAERARARLEGIAEGLRDIGASPAAPRGGGLIQAIPSVDADGNEEGAWWA